MHVEQGDRKSFQYLPLDTETLILSTICETGEPVTCLVLLEKTQKTHFTKIERNAYDESSDFIKHISANFPLSATVDYSKWY